MTDYIEKEYNAYLENVNEMASEEVMNAYKELQHGFGVYIGAISEDGRKKGFRHAMRVLLGGSAR